MALTLLIVASETSEQQEDRRKSSGAASHETYAATLRELEPGVSIRNCSCIDGTDMPDLSIIDGVLYAGSPIDMHKESMETRAAARFATALFYSGVPAFGSCAGLQIAAVASGGTCRPRQQAMEAGFARGITATDAGRTHPMLHGRPIVWDAPAMHSSIVEALGPGGTVLAQTRSTPIEAAEIRFGNGVFWGVQYHPELTITEIAGALRRQAQDLVEAGMSRSEQSVNDYAAALEDLDEGGGPDTAWQIGIDEEITIATRRTTELRNFLSRVKTA
ncbi:gamma-glutamyl-gamma-aminobutyrate hydrolase family protein [Aureimonas altamirensis]|uniref:glutamine amidotransferase-related protein n=1 Tax=Aureimonas altamirensis TaxID=370622 RepID=UPI001E6355EC|nr:gamma-glutamyl-gamma-aminobutyrate hydrolase family protein [Aureimonas altamirensis]UHD44536.1 gamma-glutamyl-gamma-aminobutyrate hydrolase family protein [Aureimonas altamirensis]